MKAKYTGDAKEITIRGTTFEKGKAVEVDDELGAKVLGVDGFIIAKPKGKKADADKG